MVAKSYQSLTQIGEPYTINGKDYVKVILKNGSTKQVRWYKEASSPKPSEPKTEFAQKIALGFHNDYITILKGDSEPWGDWLSERGARYARWWGWYFPSTALVPMDLPVTLTPIKLPWDSVSRNTILKPETELADIINSLLYDPSPSNYIGQVGERIKINITVTKAVKLLDDRYGPKNLYEMRDANNNIYVWITTLNRLVEGESATIKGIVKEHKKYKNTKQTILTRCVKE